MKIGDLVKYSEEATKNRLAAVYGGHNVSEWLGVIVDENPKYYFVSWIGDKEPYVCERKHALELVK